MERAFSLFKYYLCCKRTRLPNFSSDLKGKLKYELNLGLSAVTSRVTPVEIDQFVESITNRIEPCLVATALSHHLIPDVVEVLLTCLGVPELDLLQDAGNLIALEISQLTEAGLITLISQVQQNNASSSLSSSTFAATTLAQPTASTPLLAQSSLDYVSFRPR